MVSPGVSKAKLKFRVASRSFLRNSSSLGVFFVKEVSSARMFDISGGDQSEAIVILDCSKHGDSLEEG